MLYRMRLNVIPTQSASEGRKPFPRWHFGLVCTHGNCAKFNRVQYNRSGQDEILSYWEYQVMIYQTNYGSPRTLWCGAIACIFISTTSCAAGTAAPQVSPNLVESPNWIVRWEWIGS